MKYVRQCQCSVSGAGGSLPGPPPRVLKQVGLSVPIPVTEYDVGDQLLEGWIFFHRTAGPVTDVVRIQQDIQVGLYSLGKTLHVANLMKKLRWHDKHMFHIHCRHCEFLSPIGIHPATPTGCQRTV